MYAQPYKKKMRGDKGKDLDVQQGWHVLFTPAYSWLLQSTRTVSANDFGCGVLIKDSVLLIYEN